MNDSSTTPWPTLARDMNADGLLTLSDVWLWVVAVFFAPGDLMLWAILTYTPGLAQFLELGPGSHHSFFSAMISAGIWLAAIVVAGTLYGFVRNVDRALTATIARCLGESRRRLGVLRIWAACRLRGIRLRFPCPRRERGPDVDLDELELSELEREVLRSTALLAPGFVNTPSDIAGALDIGRREAKRTFARLLSLQLVETALSASDGESGYRLSRAGRFVVAARETTQS